MRYRLQRHDGTDCSATMVPITVLRMVPIQRYRHVMGKFKKPVFDEVSRCYQIQWSDMAYLTESIVVDRMYVSPKDE